MHRAPVLHVYWVKGIILSSKMLSVVWAFHSPPANVTAGSSEQCVKRLKFLWYLQLQLLSRSLWTEKYNHFCDHHCLVLDAIVWMWDSRSSQDLGRIKLGNWQLTWKSEEEAGWWLGLMVSSGDCWYLFRLVCYFAQLQVTMDSLNIASVDSETKKKETEEPNFYAMNITTNWATHPI